MLRDDAPRVDCVVERQNQRRLCGSGREAGRDRDGGGLVLRPELAPALRQVADQRRVVDAVVGAFELGDVRAAGEGAGDAVRVEHSLRAGGAEADVVHRGYAVGEQLRQLDLVARGPEERRALARALPDRVRHRREAVAERQAGGLVHKVEPLVAVNVEGVRALAALPVDGEGLVVAAGARVAAGQRRLRPVEPLLGRGILALILLRELVHRDGCDGGLRLRCGRILPERLCQDAEPAHFAPGLHSGARLSSNLQRRCRGNGANTEQRTAER